MIKLTKDTYKRDLLHWVYSLNVEDCDQKEYELLRKVCTCYIYNGKHNFQIDRIKITESDKVLIQERDYIHSENKEIRARFIDVAIRSGLYKKNKLELKRECSGETADVGDKATAMLMNTQIFKKNLNAATTSTKESEEFSVNMTNLVFHIGRTPVNYTVHHGTKSSHVDFRLFQYKDGRMDSFSDPLDMGFELP